MCCRVLEAIIRLSCLRYIVATITINLELYWYTHQKNRNCCQNIILVGYFIALILVIPLYIIVLINDLIISFCFKICVCCTNEQFIGHASNSYKNRNDKMLNLMSFNIQNGQGMDGKINIERTCKVIQNEGIDILCMQEVEWDSTLYSGNQTIDIGNNCNMPNAEYIAVRKQYWGGWYGDSLCTKYQILDKKTYNFTKWNCRNPRKAFAVKIRIDQDQKKYIWIVNTHLQNDPTYDENWYQVRDLMRFCDDIVHESNYNNVHNDDGEFYGLILCGDFNLPAMSSPIAYLQYKMIHCVNGSTFPSTKPMVQIDHIFLHKQSKIKLKINESKVVENDTASDHCPLVTKFVF